MLYGIGNLSYDLTSVSISLAFIQILLYLTSRTQGLFQAQTIEVLEPCMLCLTPTPWVSNGSQSTISGSCWSCSCMANMRSRDYMLGRLPVDWMHILNNEKERNYRVEQAREYRMLVLNLSGQADGGLHGLRSSARKSQVLSDIDEKTSCAGSLSPITTSCANAVSTSTLQSVFDAIDIEFGMRESEQQQKKYTHKVGPYQF